MIKTVYLNEWTITVREVQVGMWRFIATKGDAEYSGLIDAFTPEAAVQQAYTTYLKFLR